MADFIGNDFVLRVERLISHPDLYLQLHVRSGISLIFYLRLDVENGEIKPRGRTFINEDDLSELIYGRSNRLVFGRITCQFIGGDLIFSIQTPTSGAIAHKFTAADVDELRKMFENFKKRRMLSVKYAEQNPKQQDIPYAARPTAIPPKPAVKAAGNQPVAEETEEIPSAFPAADAAADVVSDVPKPTSDPKPTLP